MQTFPEELSANPITVIVNWPALLKKVKCERKHCLQRVVLVCICVTNATAQDDSKTIKSFYSKSDFPLSADPELQSSGRRSKA